MLDLCARGHPYYSQRWAEAKIDVRDIRTLADLERLPLTHKSELMAAPERFRLSLPELPLQERALWEIIYTTGSTADPTPIYNTTHDYNAYLFQSRRVADISDIRETDVIANLFPLTPCPDGRVRPLGEQRLCGRRGDIRGAAGRKLRTVRRPPLGGRGRADGRDAPGDGAVGRAELRAPLAAARHRASRRFQERPHVRDHRRSVVAGDARGPAPMPARAWRGRHDRIRPLRLDRAWRLRAMPRGWRLAQPDAGASVSRDRRPGDRAAAAGRRTRRTGRHASRPARHGADPLRRRRRGVDRPASLPGLRPHQRAHRRSCRAHQGPGEGQRHADQSRRPARYAPVDPGHRRIPGGGAAREQVPIHCRWTNWWCAWPAPTRPRSPIW